LAFPQHDGVVFPPGTTPLHPYHVHPLNPSLELLALVGVRVWEVAGNVEA